LICFQDFISEESLWLIIKETVGSNNGNEIDDEFVDRTVPGMYELSYIFEPTTHRFNDLSFAKPDFIPKRDQFVFQECYGI